MKRLALGIIVALGAASGMACGGASSDDTASDEGAFTSAPSTSAAEIAKLKQGNPPSAERKALIAKMHADLDGILQRPAQVGDANAYDFMLDLIEDVTAPTAGGGTIAVHVSARVLKSGSTDPYDFNGSDAQHWIDSGDIAPVNSQGEIQLEAVFRRAGAVWSTDNEHLGDVVYVQNGRAIAGGRSEGR